MNDPNGMVYHKGVYHLYYQHNPSGNTWGNMSWGHATSTDLVHWKEQPLAIPTDDQQDIFSGSVVVDKNNSSGFGTAENPPMVAIFTSAYKDASPYRGLQAQSLAYSLDDGQTWTKYSANPVLNRNSANFRDPKVFWYDSPGGGGYWVMAAVEATEHKVLLYKSSNLKDWTPLSEFGPANATGGLWECPDLFPLAVDGDPANVKWVMVVNINPGGVAGGSAGQYFVGSFDGTTFTSESTKASDALPAGTPLGGLQRRHLQRLDRQQRTRQLEERAVRGRSRGRNPARAERRHRFRRHRPDQLLQRRRLAAGLHELPGIHGGQRLPQLPGGRRPAPARLGQAGQHSAGRRPAVQRL